jgi:hypothetical protein
MLCKLINDARCTCLKLAALCGGNYMQKCGLIVKLHHIDCLVVFLNQQNEPTQQPLAGPFAECAVTEISR